MTGENRAERPKINTVLWDIDSYMETNEGRNTLRAAVKILALSHFNQAALSNRSHNSAMAMLSRAGIDQLMIHVCDHDSARANGLPDATCKESFAAAVGTVNMLRAMAGKKPVLPIECIAVSGEDEHVSAAMQNGMNGYTDEYRKDGPALAREIIDWRPPSRGWGDDPH